MTPDVFATTLEKDGFEPAVTITREGGGMLADHTHPFEAKALVLSGDIHIATATSERVYQQGEVFHLLANEPHSEFYGLMGVSYLVGRKPQAPAQDLPAVARKPLRAPGLRSTTPPPPKSSQMPAPWTPE